MNLLSRGLFLFILLIGTLKIYNYLQKRQQDYLYYLSYVLAFASVILVSLQSRKIFKYIKQRRQQSRFQQLNTKAKWLSSLESLDDLEYLMKKQKTIDQLIFKVNSTKQTIRNQTKFQNLLKKYIQVLKQKIQTQIGENKNILEEQLVLHRKQLELSFLIQQQEFSYLKIVQLNDLKRQNYLQIILQMNFPIAQKRQYIVQNFAFVLEHISSFLNQYISLSAELRKQFFLPLMFTPLQINLLSNTLQRNPIQNQSQFYHLLINNLITQLGNYSLSLCILQQLIKVQERQPTSKQKDILFNLKLIYNETYHNHSLKVDWKQFTSRDKYIQFKNIMNSKEGSSVNSVKQIFDIIDSSLFQKYLTKYTFQSKVNTNQIIDYFDQHYIEQNEDNILMFIHYLKLKTVEQCYHYREIVGLLDDFRDNKQVQSFLDLFKYCRIFYSFNLETKIKLVQELIGSENKQLQQKAVVLFRDMIKSFSINAMRSRYIDLDGQEFDMNVHEAIIKLSLYLKKNFFKRLLTQQTMYQMIFQHLLHFERYGSLVALLKQDVLDKYMIDYTMIEIVIIQQIQKLFENSDNFVKIQPDVQRLLGLLPNFTLEKVSVLALVEVGKIMKRNKLLIDPQTIFKNMNIDLLRVVITKRVAMSFQQLHKIYKQILLFKNPSFQDPQTDTNDFKKFKVWLSKKYYDIGLDQQGLQILRSIHQYKLPELCNTIIEIIKTHPQAANSLLFLGYDQATTDQQFQFFKQKFTQNKKKDKEITDFLFSDKEFINNDRVYSNVVAQCKFIDSSLKNPIFEMFFQLLGNNYKQAFFNSYKRKIPLHQIQFFLKQCIKHGILQLDKIVPWMYKTILAKNLSKTQGIQTSFLQFTKNISQDIVNQNSDYQKRYKRIQNSSEVDPIEKALLKKYRAMVQIWGTAPKQFLSKYINQKDINKFLQDKAFRKKEITQLVSKVQQQDIITLSKLAKVEQINLLDLIIFNICGYLNTQKIPSNIEQYLKNTTLLIGKSKQGADMLVEKLVGKIFSTRVLLSLIYGLMKLKDQFWRQHFKNKKALRILQTLAAVEQQSQFYGLLPPNMFSKQLKPSFGYESLSFKKTNILNNCLKMQNVFVISKAMYLLHGFSSEVQKQVFKILCQKFPQAKSKLSKFLE